MRDACLFVGFGAFPRRKNRMFTGMGRDVQEAGEFSSAKPPSATLNPAST